MGQRSSSSNTVRRPRWPLFENEAHAASGAELLASRDDGYKWQNVAELLVDLSASAIDAFKSVQFPKLRILEGLTAADTTPRQRVDAVKAVLSLVGQALAFLMCITILWKLGAAVMQVLEVVVWPMVVPFKILRWLAGAT